MPRRSPPPLPWPRNDADGTPLGVDLARMHNDVRRIVGVFYGRVCVAAGVELEDLEGDVLTTILRHNRTVAAFDQRRGGFVAYVKLVASCRLSNAAARVRRTPYVERSERSERVYMHIAADSRPDPEAALLEAEEAELARPQLTMFPGVDIAAPADAPTPHPPTAAQRRKAAPVTAPVDPRQMALFGVAA